MPNKKLEKIIKIARDVYNKLGSGFDERVYENAMKVGLRAAGFSYEAQKVVELTYKNHYVGEGYPDLIVKMGRDRLILELKATGKLGRKEETQLSNYLKILKLKKGLLINFQAPQPNVEKETGLEVREVEVK